MFSATLQAPSIIRSCLHVSCDCKSRHTLTVYCLTCPLCIFERFVVSYLLGFDGYVASWNEHFGMAHLFGRRTLRVCRC